MYYKFTYLTPIFAVNAILLISLGIYTWRKRKLNGGLLFSLLLFASALWSFAALFENEGMHVATRIFWSKVAYMGSLSVGPIWLLFSMTFAQYNKKFVRKVAKLIWILPLIFFIFVITNEYHQLVWPGFSLVGETLEDGLLYQHGIVFYLNVIYSYLTILWGTAVFVKEIFESKKVEKNQSLVLLMSILIPWVANFIYVIFGSAFLQGSDIAALVFTFTAIFIVLIIFKYDFFSILETAREEIFRDLNSGIIVVDQNSIVVDFNPAAKKIVGKNLVVGGDIDKIKSRVGKSLGTIVEESIEKKEEGEDTSFFCEGTGRWYDLDTEYLKEEDDSKLGQIIFFHDITKQKEIQDRVEESRYILEKIVDFLPDPTFVINTENEIIIWNKAMVELTGIEAKDMIGKKDFEYAVPIYGEKRPLLANILLMKDPEKAAKQNYEEYEIQDESITSEIFTKELEEEGQHLWGTAKLLRDNKGKIIGAIESIRDVTERREFTGKLEAKIKELSELNDLMVERELRMVELKKKLKKLEGG